MKLPNFSLPALPGIFKSKRFWTYFGTGTVSIAIALSPELEQSRDLLIALIGTLGFTVVTTYGVQDSISASKGVNKYTPPQS